MIFVTVDLLAGFVIALEAEEGVLIAPFVEADHPCLFFVGTLREVLDLDGDVGGGPRILLFFHSNQNISNNLEAYFWKSDRMSGMIEV
jgi:hypothetical protein